MVLKFTKRIILTLLMLCPLAFYGQIEGSYSSSNKGYKPINYTKVKKSNNKYTKNSPIQKLIKYNEQKDFFYLTGNIGASILNGDTHLSGLRPGIEANIGVGYQISEFIGIEAKLGYATFDGEYDILENIEEANGIKENISLTLNLTNLLFGYSPSRRFHIVPHASGGWIQHRCHVTYTDYWFSTHPYLQDKIGYGEKGRKNVYMIGGGVNFNYAISSYTKLHLDIEAYWYDTEWLDNIKGTGSSANDYSGSVTFGVYYMLGKKTGNSNKKIYSPCE